MAEVSVRDGVACASGVIAESLIATVAVAMGYPLPGPRVVGETVGPVVVIATAELSTDGVALSTTRGVAGA